MICTKLILICCRQLRVIIPSLCKYPPEFPYSQPHSLIHTGKAHNTLHLSPTDVTLRNTIFRTRQCLIAVPTFLLQIRAHPIQTTRPFSPPPKNGLGARLDGGEVMIKFTEVDVAKRGIAFEATVSPVWEISLK